MIKPRQFCVKRSLIYENINALLTFSQRDVQDAEIEPLPVVPWNEDPHAVKVVNFWPARHHQLTLRQRNVRTKSCKNEILVYEMLFNKKAWEEDTWSVHLLDGH